MLTEINTHDINVVSSVLFRDLTEDYSLRDSLSAPRICSKEVREEPGCL